MSKTFVLNNTGEKHLEQQLRNLIQPFYVKSEYIETVKGLIQELNEDELSLMFDSNGDLGGVSLTIISNLTLSGNEEKIELNFYEHYDVIEEG